MKHIFTVLLLIMSIPSVCQQLTGHTRGAFPYLEYGLGADRLGGAKITYLDSNILMQVVDSLETVYRVRLSANHYAYLPKKFWAKNDSLKVAPMHLSGSARVFGDETFDYVMLNLDARLPYRSLQQVNPSKIVVDVYGVTSNTNWITQLTTATNIRNFYYEQVEDDVFRMIIDLKAPQHWGHSIYYSNNTLVVRIKRPPARWQPRQLVVLLDAGHGGDNTGARSASGLLEKDYTLLITREIQKYLEQKNIRVIMTRQSDTALSMEQRLQLAKEIDPDLLLSIHLNSSSNKNVKGVSTYYRHIGFRPVSTYILKRMLDLDLHNFGNIGGFNFTLNGPIDYNNCLLEVAFLSNAEDEKRIADPVFHKQVARQVYKGIKDWVKSIPH